MRQNDRGNPPYWYLAGVVSYGEIYLQFQKPFFNF